MPGMRATTRRPSPIAYSCADANVLQLATVPALKPVLNQRWRCSELPWVKLSGTT